MHMVTRIYKRRKSLLKKKRKMNIKDIIFFYFTLKETNVKRFFIILLEGERSIYSFINIYLYRNYLQTIFPLYYMNIIYRSICSSICIIMIPR